MSSGNGGLEKKYPLKFLKAISNGIVVPSVTFIEYEV